MLFIFCKRLSNDDLGVARDTVFPELRPVLVSKPAVSLAKSWGGATVERPYGASSFSDYY